MKKKGSQEKRLKPRKESAKPKTADNKRLAQQTRKLLGKHYASKYRVQ